MVLPERYERLRPILNAQPVPVYLVGGAVRDAILGRESHDLDFVVPTSGIKVAKAVADALGMPFYVLDHERDVGRVMLQDEQTELDFARFRAGDTLEADLRDRDFTLNALALALDGTLIDPLHGQADMAAGIVRMTHAHAIAHDPVRAIRAIRMAVKYQYVLAPATATAVAEGAMQLGAVSAERVRDELFKTISLPAAAESV